MQVFSSLHQLTSIDVSKPVLIAGDNVLAFLGNKKNSTKEAGNGYVKQPAISYNKGGFHSKPDFVTYHLKSKIVEVLSKAKTYIALDEVVRWGFERTKGLSFSKKLRLALYGKKSDVRVTPNLIVINSFCRDVDVHVDILVYTDGLLRSIEEVPKLPKDASAYTRRIVEIITSKRQDELRNHSVALVGDVNYRSSSFEKLSEGSLPLCEECYLDSEILSEIRGVEVCSVEPFNDLKRLPLVMESGDSESVWKREAFYSALLIGVGSSVFYGAEFYQSKRFEEFLKKYENVVASSSTSAQNQEVLQLWQLRDSYIRDIQRGPKNSEKLKVVLQAISTVSNSLPQLDLKVKTVKYDRKSRGSNLAIEVGASAADLENAIKAGQMLFLELNGVLLPYVDNLVGAGAPRRQVIDGVSYFVFNFTGNYKEQ